MKNRIMKNPFELDFFGGRSPTKRIRKVREAPDRRSGLKGAGRSPTSSCASSELDYLNGVKMISIGTACNFSNNFL